MDLNNDFVVPVGIEEAWVVLNDVERIAPCLPGAQLQEIEGDEFRGIVKIKVGPITAQYKGKAHFVEQNHADKRVVIKGEGRDVRGAGNANALITATLVAQGEAETKVSVNTDLQVTGKVAQFGRGVMADISGNLMGQFADNLEQMLRDDAEGETDEQGMPVKDRITPDDLAGAVANVATSVTRTPTNGSGSGSDGGVRKIDSPEVEPVDLLDAAGSPLVKRFLPVVLSVVGLIFFRRFWRRRKS